MIVDIHGVYVKDGKGYLSMVARGRDTQLEISQESAEALLAVLGKDLVGHPCHGCVSRLFDYDADRQSFCSILKGVQGTGRSGCKNYSCDAPEAVPAPRRTRRTKVEMEAARAAQEIEPGAVEDAKQPLDDDLADIDPLAGLEEAPTTKSDRVKRLSEDVDDLEEV